MASGLLAGKIALVTGSGRGIGAATAKLLAGQGSRVVVNDMDELACQETVAAINAEGGEAVGIALDLLADGAAEELIQFALESFFALFLLGLLFSWVRERFSLWACISLHAVWVMSLRIYKELTVRDVVHPMREWVGEYDNFLGEATAFWLIFCFVVIALRQQWLRGYSGRDQIK